MADTKLSALTEATTLGASDEVYVNDSGTSKRITATNLATTLISTLYGVTSTAAELNKLDGATVTTAEINILDGVTSTAAELNLLDGSVAGTAVASKALVLGATKNVDTIDVTQAGFKMGGTAVTSTAAELNVLDGYTGSVTELNYLDTLHATGVTSTEFDYLDGVTSNIQTQLNAKASTTNATTSAAGIVELATNAETRTGTDTSRAVTPDGLTYAFEDSSHGASGYQVLPGGLIIQWGTADSTSDSAQNFSFPTAFASACYSVTTTPAEANRDSNMCVSAVSTTQFTIDRNSASGTIPFYYIAIGK